MIQAIVNQNLKQVFVLHNDFTTHRIDSYRTEGWTVIVDDTSGGPGPHRCWPFLLVRRKETALTAVPGRKQ